MSELQKRILFALPAAAVALWVTWEGGWYFYGALILLALLIQFEIYRIFDKAGFKPSRFFPYIITVWIMLIPVLPHPLLFGIALFLIFSTAQVLNTRSTHIQEFIATIFCAGYASFGLLFLALIRNMGSPPLGFILTITLFLMIWGNDVFAYFGGKFTGRHPMAPQISPNKSWEGFFFGMIGAAVGVIIIWFFVPSGLPLNWYEILPAAVVVSIFSPLGDLAESKLKRAANVKDASSILPGHGGFFDRFDGLILAAPAFFLYLQLLQIIGFVSF